MAAARTNYSLRQSSPNCLLSDLLTSKCRLEKTMAMVRTCFLQSQNLLTLLTYFSMMILLAYYAYLLLGFGYNHRKDTRPQLPFLAALSSSSSQKNKKKLQLQNPHRKEKKKIIVILGATGSGKSRLSIDLSTRLLSFNFEIINSDKMQLYKGLPMTTNKMPMHERLGVPHHLIDEFDSTDYTTHDEVTPADFRSLATTKVEEISSRNSMPMLVGGSNTFVYAFLTKEFDSSIVELDYDSISSELRYNCCFLWIFVALPVLKEYTIKRVHQVLEAGLLKELAEFYKSIGGELDSAPRVGIKRSIGLSEFAPFFQFKPSGDIMADDATKKKLFENAVQEMIDTGFELAKKQIEKIERLRLAGWNIQKLDATEVIQKMMESDLSKASEIWENEVMKPCMNIVNRFLLEE